jgi:hypothetical protein
MDWQVRMIRNCVVKILYRTGVKLSRSEALKTQYGG